MTNLEWKSLSANFIRKANLVISIMITLIYLVRTWIVEKTYPKTILGSPRPPFFMQMNRVWECQILGPKNY